MHELKAHPRFTELLNGLTVIAGPITRSDIERLFLELQKKADSSSVKETTLEMAQRHATEQTARVKGLEAHIEKQRSQNEQTHHLEEILELERGILSNMESYVQTLEEIESRNPKKNASMIPSADGSSTTSSPAVKK